jgi:hypothetical protein
LYFFGHTIEATDVSEPMGAYLQVRDKRLNYLYEKANTIDKMQDIFLVTNVLYNHNKNFSFLMVNIDYKKTYLIEIDKKGNIIKNVNFNTDYSRVLIPNSILQDSISKNYYIPCTIQEQDKPSVNGFYSDVMALWVIDTLGNVVSKKEFPTNDRQSISVNDSRIKNKDRIELIKGYSNLSTCNFEVFFNLLELDFNGNILKDKKINRINKVFKSLPVSIASGYNFFTGVGNDSLNCEIRAGLQFNQLFGRRYICMTDSNLNVIWERKDYDLNEVYDNYVKKVIQTQDKNFVGVGYVSGVNGVDDSVGYYYGVVFKFDSLGNVLWERRYLNTRLNVNNMNVFHDIIELSDGSLIVTGQTSDLYPSRSWIVGLDKHGKLLNSNIKTIEQTIKPEFYPNPFRDFIKIKFNEIQNLTSIEVIDVQGRKIKEIDINKNQSDMVIDLRDLKGSFFIHIKDDAGKVIHSHKIISQR